jgi:hypothetical protein
MVASLNGSSIFWFCSNCAGKSHIMAHHIIMCYLRKQRSTTLCFTWYAIDINQCTDVALGNEKVVK